MQPVDATSGARSLTTVRVAVPSTQTARTDSVVEQIPIVEPRPHYPISASVAEIMAHITELIKEQQTASQEALHQKNLDEARAEMEKLFEAVRGQSGNNADNKKADDGGVVRADANQISEIDDKALKVPDNDENVVTSLDKAEKATNAHEAFGRQSKIVGKKNIDTVDVNVTSKNNGDLSSLPSDTKTADKKTDDVNTDKTYKKNFSVQTGKMESIPNNRTDVIQHDTIDNNVSQVSTEEESI